jgi:hypothetical protein
VADPAAGLWAAPASFLPWITAPGDAGAAESDDDAVMSLRLSDGTVQRVFTGLAPGARVRVVLVAGGAADANRGVAAALARVPWDAAAVVAEDQRPVRGLGKRCVCRVCW